MSQHFVISVAACWRCFAGCWSNMSPRLWHKSWAPISPLHQHPP